MNTRHFLLPTRSALLPVSPSPLLRSRIRTCDWCLRHVYDELDQLRGACEWQRHTWCLSGV